MSNINIKILERVMKYYYEEFILNIRNFLEKDLNY